MFDEVCIAVILKNHQSRFIHPCHGVLQGSILSPLLYAVFIDSLPKRLRAATPVLTRPILVRVPELAGHTKESAQEIQYRAPRTGRDHNRPDNSLIIISSLLYADDVVLIGSPSDMMCLLRICDQHSRD